ncbi:MAG: hypothetical protein IT158_06105 [Bryobacterales bacterium]|nr:hypothetical protein [Bryobacterales bacterium]
MAVGAAICVLAANLVFLARVAWAYAVAWPGALESISRAAAILPYTADSYAPDLSLQAGHLLDSQGRIAEGLRFYRQSLSRDPYNNPIWLLAALAEERLGNAPAAEEAYRNAFRSEPNRAETRWMFANFLLRQGRREDALAAFRQVLERGRAYDEAVFDTVRHIAGLRQIEETVIPFASEAGISYFRFTLRLADREAPARAWSRLAGRYHLLGAADVTGLCGSLAAAGRFHQARAAWREWAEARGAHPSGLLQNGGFEAEPLGGPYDWRFHPAEGLEVFRDVAVSFTPPASAHLAFRNNSGAGHAALEQWLHLEPGRKYRLSFAWRSRNLDTRLAPAIELWEGTASAMAGRVETGPGTSHWRRESLLFTAAAPLIRLLLVTRGGAAGDFYVDDFQLQPE